MKLIQFIIKQYSITSYITEEDIISFLEERIKNYFKNDYDPKIIAAAISLKNEPDLMSNKLKLEELEIFLTTNTQAQDLIDVYKRASNIIPQNFELKEINKEIFVLEEEKALYDYLIGATVYIYQTTLEKRFNHSFMMLPMLIRPINNFFDKVMINDPNINLANNRLALLYNIKLLFNKLVNFEML